MSIQKIRNNTVGAFHGKRGFTLVEVIVVLVILAILAAILVPKLTGWIDESKGKTASGEGHLVLSALQASASEAYGEGTITAAVSDVANTDPIAKDAVAYLEGDITITVTGADAVIDGLSKLSYSKDGKITGFTFEASNGKVLTYANSKFTVN